MIEIFTEGSQCTEATLTHPHCGSVEAVSVYEDNDERKKKKKKVTFLRHVDLRILPMSQFQPFSIFIPLYLRKTLSRMMMKRKKSVYRRKDGEENNESLSTAASTTPPPRTDEKYNDFIQSFS